MISLDTITKGRENKPLRIVLLGVEGVGKSTFAAAAENPIFIPMRGERGLDELDVAKFPPAQSYNDIIDAITALYQGDHEYGTAIIDSASAAEPLIWEHVCAVNNVPSIEKVGGGYGKGYIEATTWWRQICDGLDALRDERGMNSVIIGHVKVKDVNDPETDPYTAYLFDINDRASNVLYRWADAVLFANFKKSIVKSGDGFNAHVRGVASGKRALYTEKRPAHPGKNRFNLPYELSLDWNKFISAVAIGRQPADVPAEPVKATA